MVLELIPKAANPQSQTSTEAIVIVYLHTALKGVQVGLVLGSILGSVYSLYSLKRCSAVKIGRAINYGVVLGVGMTQVMTYNKLSTSDKTKNQSRAYRLERNYNQNAMDNFVLAGMLIGQLGLKGVGNIGKVMFMKAYMGGLAGFVIGAIYVRVI